MYDPIDEVNYRYRLAINYLREANEAFSRGDWRGTVAAAQLSAENAAKAVIAIYRIPSWSHDPSGELEDVMANLPRNLTELVSELAVIVRRLAPEHGRSTYGEPERGLTPWEIYSRGDAEAALGMARRAVDIMRAVLKSLGLEIS
ncbi:HEPN domain-containing protein [Vulcanisaeta distributa]|uniref:HEPN domain protein n=1 Tax=Vulcanisaeta distributa (strain DSM 14429 / JCM 11212 / NBRC 100878 / IC-017) TaxID=572478 RepID=E1QN96_VULDI|nr:HEPN domain-containing protein [Vulcanisaeta distributa]ADN50066.1 HEPN domain protein [Vulcanisaeta distributa DSM 14429]